MTKKIECKTINVGGTLEALVNSFVTETPLIIDEPVLPFELDPIPESWNIERVGFSRSPIGTKAQLWERLSFLLSVSGYLLFPNNIQNFRTKDREIVITTTQNYSFSIHYETANLFPNGTTSKMKIYDWFDVKSGCRHNLDILQTEDDFVNQLLFFPSKRNGVSKSNKDVVAFSIIDRKDFDEFEHGETLARLKTLKLMKESGIKGTANGYDKTGRSLNFAIDIRHSYREIKETDDFDNRIENLLLTPANKNSDLWKTTQKFLTHQRISI